MTIFLSVLVAVLGTLLYTRVADDAKPAPPAPVVEAYDDADIRQILAHFEHEIARLTEAVALGIQHVDRVQNRINATVGRARKELREHGLESPGLEAEYRDLHIVDGGGGEESPVPAMHEDVGPVADEPSSIPGVSRNQLLKARGFAS